MASHRPPLVATRADGSGGGHPARFNGLSSATPRCNVAEAFVQMTGSSIWFQWPLIGHPSLQQELKDGEDEEGEVSMASHRPPLVATPVGHQGRRRPLAGFNGLSSATPRCNKNGF